MTEVAYLTSRYPDVSHTFVRREVAAVRDAGVGVRTFSVRAGRALSADDRAELDATTTLLPAQWRTAARVAAAHPTQFGALVTDAIGRTTDPLLAARRAAYAIEAVELWYELRDTPVRHVHAHFANVAADVARLTARFGNATGDRWTWSFTMHGPTEFGDARWFQLARKAGDADFVACISDYCRSQLFGLVPPARWDRFHIVHCGIDPARFGAVDRTGRTGTCTVLCVGRLVPEKAQALLLRAAATVDGCRVVLVGDGPERASLERLAAELRADVTFTGAVGQDEILEHYAAADIFCLPSFAEGVPVVLMEAMATGLPVISTTIAGIPELVRNGESGILVPPGRVDLVAGGLRQLIGDPSLRSRMGAAGRAGVLADYVASEGGRRIASLFTRVAAAPA